MKNKPLTATTFFNKVTSHHKIILTLSIVIMIAVSLFIPKMTKDTSYDAFLPKDDPILAFRNQTKETFGLKDPMVIAIVNEQGIFNKKTLQLVYELSERLKTISGIDPDQITSLSTENNIVGTDAGLEVDPFFEIEELTDKKALEVKAAIDNFELYEGSLVSNDHTTTLIVAEMLDSYDKKQHEVYKSLMKLLDEYKSHNEQFYLAGEGAVSGYLIRYIDEDAMKTNPFAAIVISIILIFAYRRLRGVVLPNIMVLASVGVALGAMAAFGVDFFVITNGLPVVLIAIAVADGIHILGEYYETAAKHPEFTQKELVVVTMTHMWRPITITSVTTVAGFLAIAASSYMPPMTYFGLFGALGVFAALVYAVFMIPSAMMFLKPQLSKAYKSDQKIDYFGKAMAFIGKVVIKYPKAIIAIAIIIIAFGIHGASKLEINEDRIKNFQADEPIVKADALINKKTDGTSYLDILVETPEVEDIFEPENLHKIEALQTYVETLPHVKGSISIVDFLKKMNQSLNENNTAYYRIPDDRELIAQYFLLYSASGDPTDFDNYVDYDYRLANIRLRMDTSEYNFEKPVVDAVNTYLSQNFNSSTIKATSSGKVTVDAHWINRLGFNHFVGAGLALLVVLLFAALSFKSIWAGILTIIPVSISVLFIYTVMGVLNIWLAVGTSMFAAIAIGVGVDFAVHTVDRLKFLLSEKGLPIKEGYHEFYKSAGRALLFNFLALALGFSVLMTSSVPPLSQFGFLVAVAVTVSFIGSLTLLPAIIYLVKPKFFSTSK
ncbi:efflux RND transporter permease subunit [Flavivirga algicola]|uniref:MMPL family transporter n=1 Tax=Flavivirga algicola TaxID=2729136 RepID=A0ABX1S392_9FLAO|nr:MMPL family transporter [Flavivirga algicola]NMH89841.1 MMPL family transporter [Flavivirga algicola]